MTSRLGRGVVALSRLTRKGGCILISKTRGLGRGFLSQREISQLFQETSVRAGTEMLVPHSSKSGMKEGTPHQRVDGKNTKSITFVLESVVVIIASGT
jgi:hypothetical protein